MATENIIFKVLFDTTDATKQVASLDGVMENATKQVDEFNKNVKGGADGLSNLAKAKKTFNDISIAESTNEIKELSAELSNATAKEKDFGKAGKESVDAYKKGKIDQVQATKQLGDAIDKGVVATQKMAVETEKMAGKMKSYKAQISELKAILPTLSGEEYVQAQAKLAHLTDAMGDQQAQIKLLASDTRALDTAMQGLQLGVGVFAGLQGAAALFGSENEDVQKALLKVNGAMAVLQSLQAIQNTLDAESGFVNSVKLYWQNLFNASTETSIILAEENIVATEGETVATGLYGIALRVVTAIQTQFGVSSATAWAIATGGVTLLLAGIAALVIAYKDMVPWVAQLTREQENELKLRQSIADVSDEAVKNSSKELATVISLGTAIKDQQLSREERLKAVVKYNELAEDGNKIDATQIDNSSLIESAIRRQTDLIVKRSLARAAENEITKIAEESLSDRQFIQDQKENILKDQKAIENQKKGIYDLSAVTTETMSGEQLKAQKTISDARAAGTKEVIRLAEERIKDADLRIKKLYELFGVTDNEVKEVKVVKVKPKQIKFEPVENVTVLGIDEVVDKLKKPLEISKPLIIDVDIIDTKQLDDTLKKINEFRSNLKQSLGTIGGDFQDIFGNAGDEIANALDLKAINKGVSDARQQLESDKAKARENEKNASKISDAERLKQREKDNQAIADSQKKLNDLEATQKEKLGKIITGALSVVSSGLGLANKAIDKNIANFDKLIDAQKTAIDRARDLADKGNSQLLDAEEKKMIKLEELRRKESRKKKSIAIADAIVNTAIAVTSALSTQPFIPLGLIAAALASTLGAVQIGVIASQPFAKGGFTGDGTGQRDNTGHIPVGIVHDNEFVMDKEYTSKNRNELEYIHKNRIPLADIIKNNQMPVMSFNNILGGLQVNNSGQLEERMRAVESAILDLPNRMPQTSMNVDSRGLSIRVTELASKEKNWKR